MGESVCQILNAVFLLMISFCISQPSHATCRVQPQIKSFRAVELALEAEEMVDEARPLVYPG